LNATVTEERSVTRTITLTLTEQEAADLKIVTGYDSTIPRAIHKVTPIRQARAAHVAAAERVLGPLHEALEEAGI
jgi:hypothetical protein